MKTRPAHIPAPPKGYVYLGRWKDIVKPAGWSAARCPSTDYCDFAYSSGENWNTMVDGFSSGDSNFHFAAKPDTTLYNLNVKKVTMKTPPKFNGYCSCRPDYDYKGHFTPPTGWRLVEIGEKYEVGDFFLASGWSWTSAEGIYGEPISGSVYPVIRPATSQRGLKGRFVSAKPAPKVELTEATKEEFRRESSSTHVVELERIKDCLSGKRDNLYGIFLMRNTAGGYAYWTDRMNNPMQPEDRPFFEALKEFIEAEIARKTPAPKVKTDMDLLKDRIEALEKENAELKTWKAGVIALVKA